VALGANFRKLEDTVTMAAYMRCVCFGGAFVNMLMFCRTCGALVVRSALAANFMKLKDTLTMAAYRRYVR
jgi:hypothetical protein